MNNPTGSEPRRPRDAWVSLGMAVSAISAALTSFDGLHQLALAAGWSTFTAPLLPLTVDAFAATATRVWLAKSTGSERARSFSRACAIGAILLSLAGNAIYHLVAAQLLAVTWVIVFGAGAIPPVVLGLVAHLAVLRAQQDQSSADATTAVLRTVPPAAVEPPKPKPARALPATSVRPKSGTARNVRAARSSSDDLLTAARAADAAYREAHGRGVTRDQLRRTLRIGGERATALLRQLKAERAESV